MIDRGISPNHFGGPRAFSEFLEAGCNLEIVTSSQDIKYSDFGQSCMTFFPLECLSELQKGPHPLPECDSLMRLPKQPSDVVFLL